MDTDLRRFQDAIDASKFAREWVDDIARTQPTKPRMGDMSEMVERATVALREATRVDIESHDDEVYYRHGAHARFARAALLAALDPHDSELQAVILRAMGFYSEGGDFGPMARVQAHDAIAALKAFAQGGSVE